MSQGHSRLRLNLGFARLEEWADKAGQVEKNALYKALFAISDGSVFRSYKVLDDVQRTGEFFVLVRDNLVVKVCFRDVGAFGVLYIGTPAEAPDLDADAA
ncbi:DUF6235 family protein [Actinokineospora sp.]|uniref:DUF6235 family protein n=1 Tax=Actinokineospora sp. TaxID=1872133 RepID=UPI0040378B6B